jgi:hypothetical protein
MEGIMGDSPVFVVVSGDSGVGKSTDQLLAWPDALFLCLSGADKPAKQFGISPRVVEIGDLGDVHNVLRQVQALDAKSKPGAVIIDDLTILAERTHDRLKPQYPRSQTFAFWDRLKTEIRLVRDHARDAGVHVFASTHLARPDTDQGGQAHKGGPAMPGRKMRGALPHIADEVYIAELEPGAEPWPGVYRCEPDADWHMKSRLGVARGRVPMNLRELLRLRGYACPRLPGMEWQESVATQVSSAILAGSPWRDVWNRAEGQLVAKGLNPGAIYWALRDGIDRATLSKRSTLLGRYQPVKGEE